MDGEYLVTRDGESCSPGLLFCLLSCYPQSTWQDHLAACCEPAGDSLLHWAESPLAGLFVMTSSFLGHREDYFCPSRN